MINIDAILSKFKESIDFYDEYENIQVRRKAWNDLRKISIYKLENDEDIDEEWIKKAEGVYEKKLPLEACLLFNKYLNNVDQIIDIDVNNYNNKIVDILYAKLNFNLSREALFKCIKDIYISTEKNILLNRKIGYLREIEHTYTKEKVVGVKINNIEKVEVIYTEPSLKNYIYMPNEEFKIIELFTGKVLAEYKEIKSQRRESSYELIRDNFKNINKSIDIKNSFERILLYELAAQLYRDEIMVNIDKKILSMIVDNISLFSIEYKEKIYTFGNKKKVDSLIDQLIDNPSNKKLKEILNKSNDIEEILGIIKYAESILKEDITIDIYVEFICKCYEISETDPKNQSYKIDIALFCEELISNKPIIFTQVIDILREMYKENIFTQKTLDTLKYVKYGIEDEDVIENILFESKYNSLEFDNDFIEKINKLQQSQNETDLELADKMVSKFIYNVNVDDFLYRYDNKIIPCIYKFYKRNSDLNALHKLCYFIKQKNMSYILNKISKDDVLKLINFYEESDKKLDPEIDNSYILNLVNEYKDDEKILEYAKYKIETIYNTKDEEGKNLINSKYKILLSKVKEISSQAYKGYIESLISDSEKGISLSKLSELTNEDIENIDKIFNNNTTAASTKKYMLQTLINYYIVKKDYTKMMEYMNTYIKERNRYGGDELFKTILYRNSSNIEFIDTLLKSLAFDNVEDINIFLDIISEKVIEANRHDLLLEILSYYTNNENYNKATTTLKEYIKTDLEIDELDYDAYIEPILDKVGDNTKKEIYEKLIIRDDLTPKIREKYYNLVPNEENTQKLILDFEEGTITGTTAKLLTLEKYYYDKINFSKFANMGKENNSDITNLIYKKVKEAFKDEKDYVESLIRNTYKDDLKLTKINEYIQSYNENRLDIELQNIFGEYKVDYRNKGKYCDELQLVNIFDKNKIIDAMLIKDYDLKSIINMYLNKIKAYVDIIRVDKEDTSNSLIKVNETTDYTFLEEGHILKFLENIIEFIKLQINLQNNNKMIVEFNRNLLIINENGIIPKSFRNIREYQEEFKTRDKSLFEDPSKITKGNYVIVNENNLVKMIKILVKNILNDIDISNDANNIKDKLISSILENNKVNSYEELLSNINNFIEEEMKSFEDISYKEKLKIFNDLEEKDQKLVVEEIILRNDTSIIAKKILIYYINEVDNKLAWIKYLIECFNNANLGLEEADFEKIYELVNDNIDCIINELSKDLRNEIFNFYIGASEKTKIDTLDISCDVSKINISEEDINYILDRL